MRGARNRELYLSFVNFASAGREGDVLGNVLAIALRLVPPVRAGRILDALHEASVSARYPARSVCRPIRPADRLWRPYMLRHGQNLAWQYHNGGIWPMIGGFWIVALVQCGRHAAARAELVKLARACAIGGWSFPEWLHGRTYAPRGMPGQSWSAAGFLLAERAVRERRNPLR
jgi:glycogen debranching enzyme